MIGLDQDLKKETIGMIGLDQDLKKKDFQIKRKSLEINFHL